MKEMYFEWIRDLERHPHPTEYKNRLEDPLREFRETMRKLIEEKWEHIKRANHAGSSLAVLIKNRSEREPDEYETILDEKIEAVWEELEERVHTFANLMKIELKTDIRVFIESIIGKGAVNNFFKDLEVKYGAQEEHP